MCWARPRLVAVLVILVACVDHERVSRSLGPTAQSTASAAGTPTTLVGAGNIARCNSSNDEATAALLDGIPGTVFALGDNAFPGGTLAGYQNCYGASWGRHFSRTRPAVGNHDYDSSTTAAGYYSYFGAAGGDTGKGYYSYDLSTWHVIVLNSVSAFVATAAGSAQEQWLKADLAAHPNQCTLGMWHRPRFYSNTSTTFYPTDAVRPFWDDLYAAGADLIINAHMRDYERFGPQTPDGVADSLNGIREIIVGTGGDGLDTPNTHRIPNSQVNISQVYGVLRLTLANASYAWQFIPVAGQTASDSGSAACHHAGPPPANQPPYVNPGGPYGGAPGDTIRFDGSKSFDPDGNTPLTYAWAFGDGSTGTGVNPTHVYSTVGTDTVTLTVTDAKGASSAPTKTSATISANRPPVAVVGGPYSGVDTIRFDGSRSSDPDNNLPLTFAWTFGDGGTGVGTTPPHVYATAGTYSVSLSVTDAKGATSQPSTTSASVSGRADTAVVLIVAGNIASCGEAVRNAAMVNLVAGIPGTVVTLGDDVFPDASYYRQCYDPTWGQFKSRSYSTLGNHDYLNGNVNGVWDYWGSQAGPRGLGYYSFDVGAWHVIVLNSNLPDAVGSAQDTWLANDLAVNTKKCTLATFHQPRFFSSDVQGWTTDESVTQLWNRLYAANADLVLNGQQHQYERLAPMTQAGAVDTLRGLRSINVGTGGESTAMPVATHPNSEVISADFGVLKLTLYSDHYTWEFVPMPGETFTDKGSGTCH